MFDIKIFGERNTGTHALKEAIETNSDSRCAPSTAYEIDPHLKSRLAFLRKFEELPIIGVFIANKRERYLDRAFEHAGAARSWKHCATNFDNIQSLKGMTVLFLVRHPGSWLISLRKNPYHLLPRPDETIETFIDQRFAIPDRERLRFAKLRPLEIYNRKIESYFRLADQLESKETHHRFIRFEDMILRQQETLNSLRPLLKKPASIMMVIDRSPKRRGRKSLDDYIDYYGNEKWRDQLKGIEQKINSQIDWQHLTRFEYYPL